MPLFLLAYDEIRQAEAKSTKEAQHSFTAEDEKTQNDQNLSECAICHRTFFSDRVTKHEQICLKNQKHPKRPQWHTTKPKIDVQMKGFNLINETRDKMNEDREEHKLAPKRENLYECTDCQEQIWENHVFYHDCPPKATKERAAFKEKLAKLRAEAKQKFRTYEH